MIVIGTIVSAGGATLVGLLFCLFALIWFWHGRRTSRIDREQDGV